MKYTVVLKIYISMKTVKNVFFQAHDEAKIAISPNLQVRENTLSIILIFALYLEILDFLLSTRYSF